jgi:hypothetical protein
MIFEPEDWADVKILLDLADNPKRDVVTTTDTPRTAVIISDELYDRFLQYKSLKETPQKKGRKS